MISLVTGKIGSGKTLYCVGLIAAHLAKGLTLYTNIRIEFDQMQRFIRKRYRRVIVQEQIQYMDLAADDRWNEQIKWGDIGEPVLVVLDEIHLFFNARNWAKTQKLHEDMLSFLSQSRKADVDVMFIAQAAATLEKQFRLQCEWEFYCRKLKDIPIPIFGSLPINRMLLVQKDMESEKAISRKVAPYDTRLWGCYNTRDFLDETMRGASAKVERLKAIKLQKVPVVSRQTMIAVACALVAVIGRYSLFP